MDDKKSYLKRKVSIVKVFSAVITLFLLIGAAARPAAWAEAKAYDAYGVYDNAGVLSAEEEADLLIDLAYFRDEMSEDIRIRNALWHIPTFDFNVYFVTEDYDATDHDGQLFAHYLYDMANNGVEMIGYSAEYLGYVLVIGVNVRDSELIHLELGVYGDEDVIGLSRQWLDEVMKNTAAREDSWYAFFSSLAQNLIGEFHMEEAPPTEGSPVINVLLDGTPLLFPDVPPQLINDRTMVPMRVIFEAMGTEVAWDEAQQIVTAAKGDILIKMTIGSTRMVVNNKSITLDVPPQIVNDRTLVPVRAVAESFGADVEWDEELQTVWITSKE